MVDPETSNSATISSTDSPFRSVTNSTIRLRRVSGVVTGSHPRRERAERFRSCPSVPGVSTYILRAHPGPLLTGGFVASRLFYLFMRINDKSIILCALFFEQQSHYSD